MELLIECVGWLAALLILAAYYLVSNGKLAAQSGAYQWLNILGAAGFVVNSGWNHAIPSAALNIVWMFIGVFMLLRRKRAADPRSDQAS